MKACIETITPDVAKRYLSHNTSNYRNLNVQKVKKYATDMKHGAWEENGESISFSKSGRLLNGQHRLEAIIESNTPVTMVVVRDVENVVDIFDVGAKRTDAQIARSEGISGYARCNQTIAMAKMLIAGVLSMNLDGRTPSISVVKRFLSKNQEKLNEVATATFRGDTRTMVTKRGSVLCAAWCLNLSGESLDSLGLFFAIVNSGFPADGRDCSPCITLRNQLISEKSKGIDAKLNINKDFNATVCAYLDFKHGVHRTKTYSEFGHPVWSSRKLFERAAKSAQNDIAKE